MYFKIYKDENVITRKIKKMCMLFNITIAFLNILPYHCILISSYLVRYLINLDNQQFSEH